MANATDAKKAYREAKSEAEGCQERIRVLQTKGDDLEGSLPGLNREIEAAERGKVSALDAFALNSNKQTESALKAARQAHETAQRAYAEGNELVEATARALKKQEQEFVRLNNASELAKRECWQAVFDEIRNNIPAHIFNDIKRLFVVGGQCSMTRQFLLDSLFPNHSTDEFQTIRTELVKKYAIDE